jgi:flagellar motor protein MotB
MAKAKPHACKCKKSQECEECPEWIFTFADLVMLMMGFFVILWVLKPSPGKANASPTANDDWIATAASIREAFGYLPDPHSNDPVDLHMLLKKLHTINPVKGPTPGSRARIEDQGAHGTDPEVQTIREGTHSIIGARLLFDRGESAITPETRKSLEQIAEKIRGHYNIVVVKGHAATDDLPDGASPKEQMDLSIRRAQVAADYLASRGVGTDVLRVEGCSTFESVNEHAYTPETRAANRRVEIEVTNTLVGQRQGDGKISPGGSNSPPQKRSPSPEVSG